MKKLMLMIGAIAIVAAFSALAPRARADDQQTITGLERKLAVVTDPDETMKYYENSDDVMVFDLMGPPREFAGLKAIHDHFAEFSGFKDVKVDFLELKVISDGKLALASSVQHYSAKDAEGKPIEMTFRLTDVWRKTNGQWKIINQHISVPVDLKTGKADMASKM